MADEKCLRFVPSRVEGLPDVAEVVVRPNRLEVLSQGRWHSFRLADITRSPSKRGRQGRLVSGEGKAPTASGAR
jgi:hypothetical protein